MTGPMPTYWTKTLIPTLRQVPAEAEVPSHQLMLRAGYLRKLAAGTYDYLPLGWRSLRKAMQIVREEMDAIGAAEVLLPALQPIELWERTGRRAAYGENLFVVTDRHGREQALGPTHEEVITELVGAYVESYKDLPKVLYQIQTKFRDEFRPRFGVLRSREFQMKDAYSFHLALEGAGGLNETYDAMYGAYCKIFERCGIPYMVVEAESGPIGGSASHEFMCPSPTGEDTILSNAPGSYAANVEKCEIGPRPRNLDGAPTGELEEIHTPNTPGIDDVVAFFKKQLKTKLKPENMLKTLVCGANGQWIIAVVRGDHDLNEAKLKTACGSADVQLADERDARAAGFAIGFVGPHIAAGRSDVRIIVDADAAQGGFWVTGANKIDHHVKHFNWQRDVTDRGVAVTVADIRNAVDGDPAPESRGGGVLRATKGIEIGHIFKLGYKYTEAIDVTVVDEKNERVRPMMGCYGIGINRILASAIEREGGHDDNGIIWPRAIAPFDVLIVPIRYDGQVKEVADRIARDLEASQRPRSPERGNPGSEDPGRSGIDVLIDDRDERPGVKFKDADLIGIPLRITIGEKSLAASGGSGGSGGGHVEVKSRDGKVDAKVAPEQAAAYVLDALAGL